MMAHGRRIRRKVVAAETPVAAMANIITGWSFQHLPVVIEVSQALSAGLHLTNPRIAKKVKTALMATMAAHATALIRPAVTRTRVSPKDVLHHAMAKQEKKVAITLKRRNVTRSSSET